MTEYIVTTQQELYDDLIRPLLEEVVAEWSPDNNTLLVQGIRAGFEEAALMTRSAVDLLPKYTTTEAVTHIFDTSYGK